MWKPKPTGSERENRLSFPPSSHLVALSPYLSAVCHHLFPILPPPPSCLHLPPFIPFAPFPSHPYPCPSSPLSFLPTTIIISRSLTKSSIFACYPFFTPRAGLCGLNVCPTILPTGSKAEPPSRGCPSIPLHVFNPSSAPVALRLSVSDVPRPVAVMALFRAFSFLCLNAVSFCVWRLFISF